MKLPTQMQPIIGFAPDMPPSTPGVITDCSNIIPTNNGFASSPSLAAQMPALDSACLGAAVTTDTGGTRRLYAGTQTRLYQQVAGAWSLIGRAGAYTGGVEDVWTFAQFGNATVAANNADVLQASVSGGSFADIAGSPAAKVVMASADFVLAFNTNEATFGDQGDRWWCSAFRDHTSWAPSVTTQATSGRLIGDGGDILAACRMGAQVVAYKARSMFVGSYVGAPVVWQWDKVPGDVGCVGPRAVCDLGGPQFFVGQDNLWLFDGTRPVPMGVGVVRDWFYGTMDDSFRHKTICAYDQVQARVWIFFASVYGGGTLDKALVYHVSRQAWGVVDIVTEAALNYATAGVTMDAITGTFDSMPSVPYDSGFWEGGARSLAVFDSAHVMSSLGSASGTSTFTTGDIGDDDAAMLVRHVRLRYSTLPISASVQGYTRAVSSDGLAAAGASATLSDGKFDCRQSGRWHRFAFTFSGNVEFAGIKLDASTAGAR